MNELEQVKSEIRALRSEIGELRAQAARPREDHPYEQLPVQGPPVPADLPPFWPSRVGPPNFDKITLSPGVIIHLDGAPTITTQTEHTLTADTYFWAKWDDQDHVWAAGTISSYISLGAALPTLSADERKRYVLVPLAKVTWASGRIANVYPLHPAALVPPTLPLPDGDEEYRVVTWDSTGWSAKLPGGRSKGWVSDRTRGGLP